MPLTVRRLLAETNGRLDVFVRGELDREIRWVQASEMISAAAPYLRPGDVVLSEERWIEEDADRFVEALTRADVAALGCGLRAGAEVIDPALIHACAQAELTLFSIPSTMPIVAIIERFAELVRADREAVLTWTIDRSARLLEALAGREPRIPRLLEALRTDLGTDVWLVDQFGRLLAPSTNKRPSGVAPRSPETPSGAFRFVPLPLTDDTPRTWLVIHLDGEATDETVITQTLPFLAVAIAHERVRTDAERRYVSEIIELILANQEHLAGARLEAVGFDPRLPTFAVEVRWTGPRRWEQSHHDFDHLMLDAVVVSDRESSTALVQDRHGRPLPELAQKLLEAFGDTAVVGVGSRTPGRQGLRRSLVEAREAASAAAARPEAGRWATAESLSTYRILLETKDADVLVRFVEPILGPLMRHDREHQTQLVETLRTFLGMNGHMKGTAQALHVHVNTLRHRLARCEQLTGRSLTRMEDRVDFFLALRAASVGHDDGFDAAKVR